MRSTVTRLGALALGLGLVGSLSTPYRAGAAAEPYLIGAVLSESGPGATLGRPAADSVAMAMSEINAAGGINGHPLKIEVIDDESTPATAVNAVQKLLDEHPIAIIGSSLTQTTAAMAKKVEDAGIPLISLASSAQLIEPVSEHKFTFKMPITDTHVGTAIENALKKKGTTKVAFIYRDDDYGKTGLEHFKQSPSFKGVDVVSSDALDSKATDATTQMQHAKTSGATAVVVWTTMPSALTALKAYKQLGMTIPLYYSDGSATPVFPALAGPPIDGTYIASTKITVADELAGSDPAKKVLAHYITEFNKAYPGDKGVSIFGGFGYDSVYVLKAAIERAKSTEGAKLRDAIEHTNYVGVTGHFVMSATDHNGLNSDSLVITQIKDQKFEIAK
jgi:branched-chain amino acid transport system substrate-binding protein